MPPNVLEDECSAGWLRVLKEKIHIWKWAWGERKIVDASVKEKD